jgi:hypothetical protein
MNIKLIAYLATLGYTLTHKGRGEYEGKRIDGKPLGKEECVELERNVTAWYNRQKMH